MIEMLLSRIVIRETSDQQSVHLREKDGERQFPNLAKWSLVAAV